MLRLIATGLTALFPKHSGAPELLRERWTTLSRMIPLLYFALIMNAWGLAVTFIGEAPATLSILVPLGLTSVCGGRLVVWWRRKNLQLTEEEVRQEWRHTVRIAAFLSFGVCLWSYALFHYGDAYAKAHIAFFMVIAILLSMLCLIQLRAAVLTIALVAGSGFIGYFITSGITAFVIMGSSFLPVLISTTCILLIQNRDFARMVEARIVAQQRHEEQSRLLHMIDDMPVAVMTVEPDTLKVNYANETSKSLIRQIEHLLPVNADDLIGTSIDVFHKDLEHQRQILSDPANLPYNARIQLGNEVLDLKASAVLARDGSYLGPMLSWALVTKEVEAENRIRHLAHYDTLTGLPNRTSFNDELERRLARHGNPVGLLYIDLDGFKLVNDTRGHRIGDMLLGEVAIRLQASCHNPAMMVSRLGGDEFAVLVPHGNAQQAQTHANQIINALNTSYNFGYGSIEIGASVGIALAPEHGEAAQTLLARADMALYAAKESGKGNARMFAPRMEKRIQERVLLEAKLREALRAKDRLFVFYQPIISIDTGEITTREALVRWHDPERGWISPSEFVPIAEQSGQADALGAFVLETACREAAGWADGTRVAVNISATQLGKGTLHDYVLAALVTTGLSPNRLEIEVTETALLDDEHDVIGDLRRLRGLGVRVALDDFGTGYSSLAHLRAFPFDKIKIDGSFVKDAVSRPDCAAVVRVVADLGKRLGVTTVAEGVETEEQFERLRVEGCMEVQGYLFGRPAPSGGDKKRIADLNLDLTIAVA